MSHPDGASTPGANPDAGATALGYDAVRIIAGGNHCVRLALQAKERLLAATLQLEPEAGASLVVLGADVGSLDPAARSALRARIGYVPAGGGLLSHLNAWENIILPLSFHHPARLAGAAAQVHAWLRELTAEPRAWLARLPEEMGLFEKKLAGCVRICLEGPELLLVDDLFGGLSGAERERAAGFAAAYHAICPQGTFVQLDDLPEA